MPRYAAGTVLDYLPFDRQAILDRMLGRLSWDPPERVRKLATDMARGCRTEGSVTSYAQEIVFYLRWCATEGVDPLEVTSDDAEAYAAFIHGYAQGTQNLKLLTVRLFFKKAIARKFVDENPFEHANMPSRSPETITPSLTKEMTERLLRSIQNDFDHPREGLTAKRDYALVTIMVRMCFRTTESAALRWGRFQETEGRIRVSFMGKGKKPAHLFVPVDVWRTLLGWKRAYERELGVVLGPRDPVFLPNSTRERLQVRGRKGLSPLRPLSRRSVYGIVTGRMHDLDIRGDRMSPHALRATGAVLAYKAGATLPQIQSLLRHSSVNTTMIYLASIMGDAATDAMDAIRLDVPAWLEPWAEGLVDEASEAAA